MQGTWVPPLVQEDSTCHRATKARVPQLLCLSSRALEPQPLSLWTRVYAPQQEYMLLTYHYWKKRWCCAAPSSCEILFKPDVSYDWCWSWNSNILATSCEELTHWKGPWCWEGLGAGGAGDDRGLDGWMASLTRWTWVWVNSGWWTGRPGVLRSMGSQRVGHNWATELNWTEARVLSLLIHFMKYHFLQWIYTLKIWIHEERNLPYNAFFEI